MNGAKVLLWFSIALMCFIIWFGLFAMLSLVPHGKEKDVFKPQFRSGVCVLILGESWEPEVKVRIEMVGKRNYLVRLYPTKLWRPTPGFTIPFSTPMEKVECRT